MLRFLRDLKECNKENLTFSMYFIHWHNNHIIRMDFVLDNLDPSKNGHFFDTRQVTTAIIPLLFRQQKIRIQGFFFLFSTCLL